MNINKEESAVVYFEKQNEQDCTIHALNNAVGRTIITKEEVVDYIDELVEKYAEKHKEGTAKDLKEYRKRFSNKRTTFFTAEIVWMTARALGRIKGWSPIYGFGGPGFNSVRYLKAMGDRMPKHIVVLGIEPRGAHHAIAVRDGMIFDSLRKKPVLLTDEEMKKSFDDILGSYSIHVSETEGEEAEDPAYFHYSGPAPVFSLFHL